tara:strand:+ start:422 stop:2125 length:1704 start_codon:yes stop_codon:yes gene_type:complete
LIIFKYVRWKNFLSTGNNFTEIQLDRNPTTLIIGENGAGKSTILDALCFGLFGKPFRNISKGQLLNTVNGSSAMVELEFRIGTKEIKVRRGIKPNVFEIYINGKMYNQDANARDYQKYLEQQILKLNYRSFTQVVILGSSTFVPFMQLKARHRREVVNEILDIQIFSIMNLLMRERIKTITADIRENEYQHELAEEKITMQEKYIKDTKSNKKNLITEKTNLMAGNEEEVFKQEANNKILKVENETYISQITDTDKVKEQFEKMKDIQSTLTEKKNTNSKMLTFFEDNDICPTCEQPLDNAEEMISAKQQEVEKFTTALNDLTKVLAKSQNRQKEIKDIHDRIRTNEVKMAQSNSSIKELEKFNATLASEIKALESGTVTKEEENKLKKLKKDFGFFDKEKSKLREDLTYSEAARNMLQDTGIKTKVIKKYLPIMNKLINTYLNSMEFYVNFTLDENFNETIKSRYRDEFTYASFSEGEKMRIDLALLFTWRAVAKMKNSTNTNLLILDEIFDSSLDGTGTDEFLKILNTLGDENVFVISHKQDALADKFRSTIKFEKVKNFSHVVE